jgi:hypothetical protein
MFKDLKANVIQKFHFTYLNHSDQLNKPLKNLNRIWEFIQSNHLYNTFLWQEEDQARRINVPDKLIADNKRAIDKYNQKRNDTIEKIDIEILSRIPENHFTSDNIWINSETAGSIIDRMSINSLKCFHMEKQTKRETDKDHIELCTKKLLQLQIQGDYLASCFNLLLANITAGKATYKIYRQFKMYNDKKLNPYLYENIRET